MFSVRIRDHIMIAHSLPDPFFGPASQMHGATYVVDAEFFAADLTRQNVVIDIGFAANALSEVLSAINYQNLDAMPEFAGKLTTTEFLAREIHARLGKRLKETFRGRMRITLGESHVAWASYDGEV